MPMYEYACTRCEHAFEHLHRSRTEPKPACPKCGAEVEKLLSAVSAGRSSGSDLASLPRSMPSAGGCGRCGDPQGPCSMG